MVRDLARLYRPDRAFSKAIPREREPRSATEVLFGGIVDRSPLRITEMSGARTRHVLIHQVRIGAGLSGGAMPQERPAGVSKCFASREITHKFDAVVRDEGLWSKSAHG
jgi:hypothetical protein